MTKFFVAKLNDCIEKYKTIIINMDLLNQEGPPNDIYNKKLQMIKVNNKNYIIALINFKKEACLVYLKELKLLSNFYNANQKAFRKVRINRNFV